MAKISIYECCLCHNLHYFDVGPYPESFIYADCENCYRAAKMKYKDEAITVRNVADSKPEKKFNRYTALRNNNET